MKIVRSMLLVGCIGLVGAGCGPGKTEREAKARERLALEEQARREAAIANKAISRMTEKVFRRRTPEEEAKHQAEVARQVQELFKVQHDAEANAIKPASKP